MTVPELAPVGHDRFVAGVHALAEALAGAQWRPDYLVGIGRGGLVPGAYLSHRTGIPMLSVDYSSGVPGFAAELVAKLAVATRGGRRILLVDDINDSGSTIAAIRRALGDHGGDPDHVRVAVLIDNVRSQAKVDYRAEVIDRAADKRWFVFPWEQMAEQATIVGDARSVPERLS